MSETTIQGKLPQPAVRVSSTDPFSIQTPVARPTRPSQLAKAEAQRAVAGGQAIRPDRSDIEIVKRPSIDHTTASSSSRQVKVIEPMARRGSQPQRAEVAATLTQTVKLTEAEALLVNDLLKAHHDGSDSADARELARSAASKIHQLSR